MLFSSITFLYVFLPCVVLLYFIVPNIFKNYILLAASLVFYAWGETKYIPILLFEIISGYIFGILIECNKEKSAKILMLFFVVILTGILGYFKYSAISVRLPVGISFYTFQVISYVIDVYRKEVPSQKNPFTLAVYVAMFPQLVAGPIVRYKYIARQLEYRKHSLKKASEGITRFVTGLAKKVLIANELGHLCSIFRTSNDMSVAYYWLYAIAFTFQIYYDFSGYSDMAIGLGKIFGFIFKENFNYPYISKSITEFWRRWHISLGSWFRDYIYIPIGGNRVSILAWFRNIAIVWFLTGLWHGAELNFIVWGLYFAVFLVIEKLFLGDILRKAKVWNHIYVMFLVVISFVIFNSVSMSQALSDISGMFGLNNIPILSDEFIYYFRSYAIILAAACIGAAPVLNIVINKLSKYPGILTVISILEPIFLVTIMLIITAYLIDGSFNPFLYFRF